MATTRTGKVTTKDDVLSVRSGPSTSYDKVGSLAKGTSVTIYEIRDVNGSQWGRITYQNKSDRWICIKSSSASYWYVTLDDINDKTSETKNSKENAAEKAKKDTAANIIEDAKKTYKKKGTGTKSDVTNSKSVVQSFGVSNEVYIQEETQDDILELQIKSNAKNISINHSNSPKFVQNSQKFPAVNSFESDSRLYKYDYLIDYDDTDFKAKHQATQALLNLNLVTPNQVFNQNVNFYNRFKIANPNEALSKTFAHVFFVRPNLNVLKQSGGDFAIPPQYENKPNLYYTLHHSPEVLRELIIHNGQKHNFMMSLSNKAESFEISDEYIKTDTYGDGYTGYKIPYGKHNVESKTASTFKIEYTDDHDLHVYQIHKTWVDYIAAVYRGEMSPFEWYIKNKIIDYATAVYYILCAEDNETILFWSKYYGVFPTMSPSSVLSWGKGNLLANPNYSIEYQYAFKEDYNPLSLVEFNGLGGSDNPFVYVPTYSKNTLGIGQTWMGAPFVETVTSSNTERPYTLKLRFRPE